MMGRVYYRCKFLNFPRDPQQVPKEWSLQSWHGYGGIYSFMRRERYE
jgi:hypothetical protein